MEDGRVQSPKRGCGSRKFKNHAFGAAERKTMDGKWRIVGASSGWPGGFQVARNRTLSQSDTLLRRTPAMS